MIKRLLLALGLVAVSYAILYFLFAGGCFGLSGPGHYTLKKEILSPSDTLKISKYEKQSGATVSNSIRLLITHKRDTSINEQDVFFISYVDSIEIKWVSDTEILIKHPKELQVFKKDSVSKGIKIKYDNLFIKDPFDSTKKTWLESDSVKKVELLLGDWRAKGKRFAFQAKSSIIINSMMDVHRISYAIQSAKISRRPKSIHTDWIVMDLQVGAAEQQIILQRNGDNSYHFLYRNDWFKGEELAELVSDYLEKNQIVNQ